VFVVASARDGFDPAAVLLEWEGVRRDTPPSREAGQGAARSTKDGAAVSSGHGYWLDADGKAATLRASDSITKAETLITQAFGGGQNCAQTDVSTSLSAHPGGSRLDFQTETFVAHAFDARQSAVLQYGNMTGPLDTDGHSVGVMQPVAFSAKDHGADATSDLSPTLRAMGHADSHANGGGQMAVALALRGRDGGATAEVGDDAAFALRASSGGGDKPHVMAAMQVRRLTPTECERLQGFPVDYTAIPWRGRPASECPDGPRYKALGNSWAVPVVRWIGRRIAAAVGQ
jgi:DNA (cytosine-5)-methyltransferase 1